MSETELSDRETRDREPILSVVTTIAEREGTDPTSLAPLHESIDAGAVAAVLESADDSVTVEFTHLGYDVVVRGDGTVRVGSPPRREVTVEA